MSTGDDRSRELVLKASQGEAGALDALLAQHLPGLQAYLKRRAGRVLLAKESSSDLAQSVCREALEGLADGRFEYRGEAEFKQWLFQAALFKIQARRRYHGADMRAASGSLPGEVEEFFQTFCTPSQDAGAREELEAVERAMSQLPDRYHEIILLSRIEGLSHKEIGERLDITEKNSSMLLARAISRLATLAKKEMG